VSTPTHARPAAPVRPGFIPQPRRPADPPVHAPVGRPAGEADAGAGGGLYGRHAWLIPATAIASIVAIFVAMILLTWAAGGGTPFNR
jgi:hypothetical protein